MARITKGILGGISGKIGTVVGARVRGADIIRSLPTPSKKPPSAAQEIQRTAFATASVFLQPVTAIVSAYFGSDSGTASRRNNAMSYTIKEAMDRQSGSPVILYNKVLLSKGDLAGIQNPTVTALNDGLHLTWEDNSDQGNANKTDIFCTAVYSEMEKRWDMQKVGSRKAKMADLVLAAAMLGANVHVYAYFRAEDGSRASTSSYLGEVGL